MLTPLIKRLRWTTPITLALGSVLFALLLCELILRLFFPQNNLSLRGIYIKDNKLGYRPLPKYQGKLSDLEFKIAVNINSRGFRDQERPIDIDKETYRILSLGDSFTFGLAVNLEDTYSHRLETLLNKKTKGEGRRAELKDRVGEWARWRVGEKKRNLKSFSPTLPFSHSPTQSFTPPSALQNPRFQVFNLGVPGYGPDSEYYILERYISIYKPELVLLGFFTGNDVRDAMLGLNKYDLVDGLCVWNQETYQKWMNFKAHEGKWKSVEAPLAAPTQKQQKPRTRRTLKSYLRSRLHLYQLIAKSAQLRRLAKATNVDHRPLSIFEYETFWLKRDSDIIQQGYAITFEYLAKMKKLTEDHGARFALLLIPPKEQVHNIEWEKSKQRFSLKEDELERGKPQRLIKEWAAKNQVEAIDLLDEFRLLDKKGVRLYFYKDGHWNPEGHKRAAEIICRHLFK